MRKNLLFLFALILFFTAPSFADIMVEEATDAEYLINSGYSQAIAEDVFMLKNRASGKTVEPLYEKSSNIVVKGWRKLFSYIDPAQETYDRIHHDIKLAPSFSDL